MQQEKPDLRVILDHYDVVYKDGKTRQKVLCPVHDERVPSCSIDLDEGWFNCHACDSKGDGWNLIMEKERCDFGTAVKIAEGLAANGSGAVSRTGKGGSPGLFGRTRPGRRGGQGQPYRPRLFSDGRS